MLTPTRLVWLALGVGALAIIRPCLTQSPNSPRDPQSTSQATQDAVTRYAAETFVAGCRIRPQALIQHPHFGSLPFHAFLPEPLSLGRLDAMGVEELVVLCGPATNNPGTNNSDADPQAAGIEWAAAARTTQPIRWEALRQQWRRTLVARDVKSITDGFIFAPLLNPLPRYSLRGGGEETKGPLLISRPTEPLPWAAATAIRIENHDCFQLPAGSFFPPPRTYGELRFTDRAGRAVPEGIDIGSVYRRRGYVEGTTESSAIFSLNGIRESDLVADHLPLELRLNVFIALKQAREYSVAQIELRNPDTGLRSQPIAFEAKSYQNHRLDIPRKLAVVTGSDQRDGDLLKDLVSGGRLEVILKGTAAGVYVGVEQQDLNVWREAFEYAYVSDREIAVAQSSQTLQRMLAAASTPTSLARRLSDPAADVTIIVQANEPSQRTVLKNLAHTIGLPSTNEWSTDGLSDLTATLSVNRAPLLQVAASFDDTPATHLAAIRGKRLLLMAQLYAHQNLLPAIYRNDAMNAMLSLVFDGVETRFPTDTSAGPEQRAKSLLAIVDATLENVQVAPSGNVLTVTGAHNPSLSEWPPAANLGLADIEAILARDLKERKQFDLADEMYQRVTARLPHVPQTWFQRAHQLAYNTSFQFDGDRHRYAWVRRGIEVLLDGAQQNPETTDLTWMAARFISKRIGYSDNRVAYRRLFSQDEKLHRRLANIIDLEKARSADHQIDNYLVARALFEHCIERHTQSQATSTIPSELFLSRPAATQARYAQSLSEAGHWDAARTAWQQAERMYVALKSSNIPAQDWDRIGWQNWLSWCQQEQTAEVQQIRKWGQAADAHAAQANLEQAHAAYRDALEGLAELHRQQPVQAALVAGEQRQLAARYRNIAAQLSKPIDPQMDKFLIWLEQTRPLSEALLPAAGT